MSEKEEEAKRERKKCNGNLSTMRLAVQAGQAAGRRKLSKKGTRILWPRWMDADSAMG